MDMNTAIPAFGATGAAPRAPGMPAAGAGAEGAKKTAQDFESFFATSMLESMTQGIKTDKLFGGGQGETLYRSMLNQEYGKAIAAHGGLGIADAVRKEIIKMQQEQKL